MSREEGKKNEKQEIKEGGRERRKNVRERMEEKATESCEKKGERIERTERNCRREKMTKIKTKWMRKEKDGKKNMRKRN